MADILIVEDDRDLCNYLICNLQVLFEEVYEAHDGMEALPILTSRRPQIVLSDIKTASHERLRTMSLY